MRIGLVVPYFEVGGVEVFLLRLARRLRGGGHAVTVFATDARGAWWGELAKAGIEAEYLPADGAWSHASHARSLAKRWRGLDVLLLNHSRIAQASLPWLPRGVVAIPVFHNDAEGIFDVGCANERYWTVGVAVSPGVQARAAERIGAGKLVCIPNGVELPSPDQLSRRAPRGQTLKLLFVGRIAHEQKGVLLLPAILAGVLRNGVDAVLTVVGSGPDLERLTGLVASSGLSGRVTIAGAVNGAAVYEHLLAHHVLLAPSFFEGLGISLLEAQACGCVPVASRLPGVTDIAVEDERTGLLARVGDVGGFVDCVTGLAASPDRWNQLSAAATSRIASTFSADRMGAAYEKLFEEARGGVYRARPRPGWAAWHRNEALTWRDHVPTLVRPVVRRVRRLVQAAHARRSRSVRREISPGSSR